MRARSVLAAAFGLAGLLAGCGNIEGVDDELVAVQGAFGALAQQVNRNKPKPDTSVITGGTPEQVRQAIAPVPGPLKSVIVVDKNESAVMLFVGNNGPHEHWATPTGQIITLKGGMLTGTRGLGYDLMSVSGDGSVDLIRRQALGNTDKVYRFLNGTDKEIEFPAKCTVSPRGPETVTLPTGETRATTKMRETCLMGRLTINNYYWVAGGEVVQSRQWLSREMGELVIQSLRN